MSPEDARKWTIRVVGLKPGKTPSDLAQALQRIYRRRSIEEITRACQKLPLTLTRSATTDQAKALKAFFDSRGIAIEIKGTAAKPAAPEMPKPSPTPPRRPAVPPSPGGVGELRPSGGPGGPIPSGMGGGPPDGIERRKKPRTHSGFQLRPLGTGEILDQSARLLFNNFKLFIGIELVPFIIYTFFYGVILVFLLGGVDLAALQMDPQSFLPMLIWGLPLGVLGVLVYLFLYTWAKSALIFAVSETYLGHSAGWKESFVAVRPKLWKVIGTEALKFALLIAVAIGFAIIGLLAQLVGTLLFSLLNMPALAVILIILIGLFGVIVFFYLILIWTLSDNIVILENLSGWTALQRSRYLMGKIAKLSYFERPMMKVSSHPSGFVDHRNRNSLHLQASSSDHRGDLRVRDPVDPVLLDRDPGQRFGRRLHGHHDNPVLLRYPDPEGRLRSEDDGGRLVTRVWPSNRLFIFEKYPADCFNGNPSAASSGREPATPGFSHG